MPPRNVPSPRWIAIALFAAAATAGAQAELLKVSPFLSAPGAAATPTSNAPLEYRGSMDVGDVQQFRIVDPQRKVGSWLKVGERDQNLDVVLKQHDTDHDTITVDHGGQSLVLPLHTAKVVSAGAAPQMLGQPQPQPPPMGNVSPAVINTVVPNPTPADEQRRLEAVAAEVARRRALREQAAQQAQGAQPGAPQPMVTRQDMQQLMQQQQNAARQRANQPGR